MSLISIPEQLSELRPVDPEFAYEFFPYIALSGQVSGRYYFPYLCFYAGSDEKILWERYNHSICVYILSRREGGGWQLSLMLPPFPQCKDALAHAATRIRQFTGRRQTRIVWTDELNRSWVESAGFTTRLASLSPEFLYDATKVREAAGKDFERMRRMINKARRLPGLEIRPYRPGDAGACKKFLRDWVEWNKRQNVPYGGVRAAKGCIDHAFSFGALLRGEVLTLDGRVCGFTFGGPVTQTSGSLLVTLADKEIPGLAYLQRYHFMASQPETAWFSDTTAAGREGLAHLKMAFRPRLHPLYRARREDGGKPAMSQALSAPAMAW